MTPPEARRAKTMPMDDRITRDPKRKARQEISSLKSSRPQGRERREVQGDIAGIKQYRFFLVPLY
jgi:hypothetical protein